MKRLIVIATLLLLMGLAPRAISAQDASPAAEGSATSTLLSGLGYPDLVVTTDGKTNDLPAELAAGRYHVVLHNTNAANSVSLDFYQPPAGTSTEDAIAIYSQSMTSETPPDLFYKLIIPGGVSALPNGTADGIIDLGPGSWFAGVQIENNNGPATGAAQPLSVTGTMPELTDPAVDVTVTLSDLKVDLPDSISAGPQIWKVTNAGAMPHFVDVSKSSVPLTQEAVQATFGTFIGTPAPDGVTPIPQDAVSSVAATSVLSPGQSMWIAVDLEPGQYVAACFLSGPGDVQMHAAMGMFKIFSVE